jgi:hypothetical protein
MACIASSREPKVTNPQPLLMCVLRSLKRLNSSTVPYLLNNSVMSFSVTDVGNLAKNSCRLFSGPAPA